MRLLAPVAPAAVLGLLRDQLASLSNSGDAGLMSIGLLMALWSSSAAMVSVIDAMNRAYDIEDSRPWWKRRLIAIGLTIGLSLFILTSFGLIVAGPWLANFLGRELGLAPVFTLAWEDPAVALCLSAGIHRFRTRVLPRPRRRAGMGVDYAGRARGYCAVVSGVAGLPLLRHEFRQLRRSVRNPRSNYSYALVVLYHRACDGRGRRTQARGIHRVSPWGRNPGPTIVGQRKRLGLAASREWFGFHPAPLDVLGAPRASRRA